MSYIFILNVLYLAIVYLQYSKVIRLSSAPRPFLACRLFDHHLLNDCRGFGFLFEPESVTLFPSELRSHRHRPQAHLVWFSERHCTVSKPFRRWRYSRRLRNRPDNILYRTLRPVFHRYVIMSVLICKNSVLKNKFSFSCSKCTFVLISSDKLSLW